VAAPQVLLLRARHVQQQVAAHLVVVLLLLLPPLLLPSPGGRVQSSMSSVRAAGVMQQHVPLPNGHNVINHALWGRAGQPHNH
jgi:hypothetical protein